MFCEDPPFPACPSFGFTPSPRYSVTITTTAGGRERRNRNWARPLHVYAVTVGPRMEAEVAELLEFWHAMGGPECGFRFKDSVDFKSCRLNLSPTAFDQPLELIPGSPGGWQLIKLYNWGTRTQTREILKPVTGTIRIADAGVEKTEGVHWLMDYTTGLATLFFTPAGTLTWGGEFDVPARFDSEFPVEMLTHQIQSVQFQIAELRDPQTED